MILNNDNKMYMGITFSNGIEVYKKNKDKNFFEGIATIEAIEESDTLSETEKSNLVEIENSNMEQFEKRIRIMRALDGKEFSAEISLLVKLKLPKMEMVENIIDIFRNHYIKSNVLKKEFGEVLTPLSMVKEMVDKIDESFWKTPYDESGNIKTILDCCNGSGVFLWYVIYKLMDGLSEFITDQEDRYKFIIEKMIYACEIQKRKMHNWICSVDLYDKYDINIYRGSFLEDGFDNHMKEVWGINKFSLIVSNPPYQEMDGGAKSSAKPIYNLFTLKSIKISDKILFITPSRWFAGGKGLDTFRKYLMESNKIRLLNHFNDASKIFGNNVDITGGVSYFLFDNYYNGDCKFNNVYTNLSRYDIIVNDSKYTNLIDKFQQLKSISEISNPRSYFGIPTNFTLTENKKISNDYIKCYFSQNKGFEKWVHTKYVRNLNDRFRIATPRANGEYPKFGNLFIVGPNECLSDSYISFYTNNIDECRSLLSYLKTDFANRLLSLRKISQTIKPDTCKWIPLVPLDREWNDKKLFEYFNLSYIERLLIKNISPNTNYETNQDFYQYSELKNINPNLLKIDKIKRELDYV